VGVLIIAINPGRDVLFSDTCDIADVGEAIAKGDDVLEGNSFAKGVAREKQNDGNEAY
jgi:hypothetical protein